MKRVTHDTRNQQVLKKDWHPAEIICEVKKAGSSIAALSRNAGLSSSTLSNALYRHWPKGEQIIANFLGLTPKDIWPERFNK